MKSKEERSAICEGYRLAVMADLPDKDLSDLDEYEVNLFGSYYGIRLARTTESVWLVLRNQSGLYSGIRLIEFAHLSRNQGESK